MVEMDLGKFLLVVLHGEIETHMEWSGASRRDMMPS